MSLPLANSDTVPLLKPESRSSFAFSVSLFAFPTKTELQGCWELCRLHNNIGFWVVWIPTAWSILMVYHAQTELSAMDALIRAAIYIPLCFGVKSLIMTIDDILDYDIDGRVERTKNRPLPRGAISLGRAWLFFGLQVVLGVYLAFTVLSTTALHASMAVWPLYIIYPTCKRWTNLAPIPLGLMFKVGIFMGWSDLSIDGSVPWHVLVPIYLGACLWTITYETVYQHQDKVDDMRIGINSPALLCREYTIGICAATALGFLGLLLYGGSLNDQGVPFYVSVGFAGVMLIDALLRTDIDKPDDCKHFFLLTPLLGQIILGGFVVDAVLHRFIEGIAF
ncbi:4-hydroxybenzoate polyprenyltransferase, mitochondrial [Mycena sanguinolenta]|uniref:4-hydroxybenzoate polyprenyltransferase, mitochondrial n=1 Tax=Mycena sanguinolenta TaxID=230812 RepID=A0A8H6Y8Z8_9AGAR|nr:4-hydroxybenzoate polyprenyltransferase, mitochondrial [Mycena sanguinolenta]